MEISVFFSYPKPHMERQRAFCNKISDYLAKRGFSLRTLGVTDYDMDAPLKAIRRLMLESNGLIAIAFRRTLIHSARVYADSGIADLKGYDITDEWITSSYCHIEPAMAYQIGLPTLILREKGVIADGILERGTTEYFMPEFDLDKSVDDYLASPVWRDISGRWEGYVRRVADQKGSPPRLF